MLGVTLAGAVGNVLGSLVAYYVGVWGGRPFAERYLSSAPPWGTPPEPAIDPEALGRECVRAVLAATDTILVPGREALRGAVTYLLGLLTGRAPARRSRCGCRPTRRCSASRGPGTPGRPPPERQ